MFTDVPLLNREKSSAHSPPDVARRLATMLRIPSNMLFSGCTYFHNDLFELPIVVSMVTLLPAHTLQPCMHYNVYTTARPRLQVLHLFEAVFHLFISSMVVELYVFCVFERTHSELYKMYWHLFMSIYVTGKCSCTRHSTLKITYL